MKVSSNILLKKMVERVEEAVANVALLMRRRTEHGTWNREKKPFRKASTRYI